MSEFEDIDPKTSGDFDALAAVTFELLQRFAKASDEEIKGRKGARAKRDPQSTNYAPLVNELFKVMLADPYTPNDANKLCLTAIAEEFNNKQEAEKKAMGVGPKVKHVKQYEDGDDEDYMVDGCQGTKSTSKAAADADTTELYDEEALRKREELERKEEEEEIARIHAERDREAREEERRKENEEALKARVRKTVDTSAFEGAQVMKKDDDDEMFFGGGGKKGKGKGKGKK